MHYSRNPALQYIPISDDEVLVKGSHLEGFSLIVTDDTRRGLARGVVDALGTASSADDVHRHLVTGIDVTVEEIDAFLDEMASAGAAQRHGERGNNLPEWISFLRFGYVDAAAQTHPVIVCGSEIGASAVRALHDLGLDANFLGSMADVDLDQFATPDVSTQVADRIEDGQSGHVLTEEDLPDDNLPRLAVFTEGAPLTDLFDMNSRAVELGVPILYTQVAGSDYAVGPQVVPGSTACFWEFERQRSRSLFSYSEYAVLAAAGQFVGTPLVTRSAGVAAAVPYLVELALLGRSMLAGQVLRGRATTGETSRHSIMRLPRCPICLPTRPLLRNLLF